MHKARLLSKAAFTSIAIGSGYCNVSSTYIFVAFILSSSANTHNY